MYEPFRWIILFTFFITTGISAFFRYQARKTETISRRSEGLRWALVRLCIGLPLFLSIVIYIVNPNWMSWSEIHLPGWARWVGAVFAIGSLPWIFALFSYIGGNISETVLTKNSHELVETGPYRWVRHPLYSGSLLMLAGIGLMAANAFILSLVFISWVGVVFLIIPAEERNLIERFGEEYELYRSRTGKLLPKFLD
jgi:protein-S-isoprenylcysteine O-methyltransferase Ste14